MIKVVNIGKITQVMTELTQDKVADPVLGDWIVPDFSTTTDNDKPVTSIVMMAKMKEPFEHELRGCCGFPCVAL